MSAHDDAMPVLVCRRTEHGDRPLDALDVPCGRCGRLVWLPDDMTGADFPPEVRGREILPICQECLPPEAELVEWDV